MAWNGSNSGEAESFPLHDGKSASDLKRRGCRFPFRGAIAGAIVVVGAGIAAWWLWPAEENAGDATPSRHEALIKEVAPKLTQDQQEKIDHPGQVKIRGKWYPEYDENGGKIWYNKHWVRYHTPVVTTSSVSRLSFVERTFKNRADRDIGNLLNMKPGTMMIAGAKYTYGERFVNDFLRSLKHPIVVSKDDDERTAELKRAVNEAKIELKARYDAGEDISKIMEETRESMRELGAYRQELDTMVRKAMRETKDPNAMRDLFGAANTMLEQRGAKPLRVPSMLIRHLEINANKEKKETKK